MESSSSSDIKNNSYKTLTNNPKHKKISEFVKNEDKNIIMKKNKQNNEKEQKIETLKITLNDKLPAPKKWDENKIRSYGYHKLFLGYLNAYFDHCPIKVSPNMIWQLILNKFSKFVDSNSEELREHFVNFKGTKNLECIRIGTFEDIYRYQDDLIEEFCKKISDNIGTELSDVLTPNFSTSTKETIIAGKVSIMATFKKYFKYSIDMCSCGIPYIILEGNLQDWEKILEKLKILKKCGFSTGKMVEHILKIIDTKKGEIDLNFWRKIIMETKETVHESNGCMSFEVEKNIISGWILDFYDSKFEIIENEEDAYKLNEEVINSPVSVMQMETGEKKDAVIIAGIGDLKQDPINYIVEPIVNYFFSFNEYRWRSFEIDMED